MRLDRLIASFDLESLLGDDAALKEHLPHVLPDSGRHDRILAELEIEGEDLREGTGVAVAHRMLAFQCPGSQALSMRKTRGELIVVAGSRSPKGRSTISKKLPERRGVVRWTVGPEK